MTDPEVLVVSKIVQIIVQIRLLRNRVEWRHCIARTSSTAADGRRRRFAIIQDTPRLTQKLSKIGDR